MAYQVLARKSRPQDFSHLIGQEPIVTALRNALQEGRVAQAYLFSGIRGVGKTSAARVLAKALNCQRGPAADPCNDCDICSEITTGADLDVLEIDAATYSKVEQVRELTESLRYAPTHGRYKVVILDEVHRLSRQAFDALLKIIEEPPPHLVFIFATTEIDQVPATILSRCQEFTFRRVPVTILADHLATLCEQESIDASPNVLRLIARAGEGSVRDSVALLDQLATFGSGAIRDEDASRLLGGLDAALFHNTLAAILGGDSPRVITIVRELESSGRDPRQAHSQFLNYCRDALHLRIGADPADLDLSEDERGQLLSLVETVPYEDILRLQHQLLTSETSIRHSDSGMLALEIAWLRAAELPKLAAVEHLLAGLRPPSAPANPAPISGMPSGGAPPSGAHSGGQSPSSRSSGSRSSSPQSSSPLSSSERPSGTALLGKAELPSDIAPAAGPQTAPPQNQQNKSGKPQPAEAAPASLSTNPEAPPKERTSTRGKSPENSSDAPQKPPWEPAPRGEAQITDSEDPAGARTSSLQPAGPPLADARPSRPMSPEPTSPGSMPPDLPEPPPLDDSDLHFAAGPQADWNEPGPTPSPAPIPASEESLPTSSASPSKSPRSVPASTRSAAVSAAGSAVEIDKLLAYVSSLNTPLGVRLDGALALRFENSVLTIVHPADDRDLPKALQRTRNTQLLDQAVVKIWGPEATWALLPDADASIEEGDSLDSLAATASEEDPAILHPQVQTLLDIFGGQAKSADSP
ncbi:MAG: DNA polymerase III subunit gamma/tau [Acidobacteriota bacterium]